MAEKKKIIFDCDTGIDDAVAIVCALYNPDLDILGFTCVNGNVPLANTSRNTLDLVRYLGFDTPVARGAAAPLYLRRDEHAPEIHGRTGLGDLQLPESQDSFYDLGAIEMIWQSAQRYPGELEILATGPLTNIAIALLLHPELEQLVKHIWFMGGAIAGGNIVPAAEFNIRIDPEAAHKVITSSIPTTMVGLDATLKSTLTYEEIEAIRQIGTPASDVVSRLMDFTMARCEAQGNDCALHDAMTLAAFLGVDCIKTESYFVDVECQGNYTFGHTYCVKTQKPNCQVAVDGNTREFANWVYESLLRSRL